MKIITRTIWILSFVSLFTDMASEMLYPVMPLFLKHIGFTAIFIGVLEGVAEAVAGLTKGYFGRRSDISGKRLPFVQLGYGLSALSKPMLGLMFYPWWIFFSRTTDRLGKGIRTGARDALLSDECTPATRGRVFGFHKSLDTFGAVLGPAIALLYLYFYPDDYRTLFFIAFAPGLLAITCTLIIKEKPKTPLINAPAPGLFAFTAYWKQSPPAFKKLATGLLVFALFNSSDVFLLLRMKESGLSDTAVISVYIFYNLIFSIFAYPLGIVADKIGLKTVLLTGICIFALVYSGFALTTNIYMYLFLFAMYGVYAAATEGISKAWISNLVDKSETGSAIGTFSGFQSLAALGASTFCGVLWYSFGATFTFLLTALAALIVVGYLAKQPYLQKKVI
ncbi:MAG: MFS transporter [Ferruginibacter sp.]